MPDDNGKLSDEERTRAVDWVNEKAQNVGDPCPHCGNVNTSVAQDLFRLAVVDKPLPQRFIAVVPVVCNNCGFIRVFSALALGIELPPPFLAGDG